MTPVRGASERRHAIGRLVCLPAALAALLALLLLPHAGAEEFVSGDWQFQLAPYAWALAIDGDVTVKGQESDIDLSFQDILDELNVAAMLETEARKGRMAVFTNLLYANLGSSSEKGPLEITPDVNLFLAGFGGYYRLGPYEFDSATRRQGLSLVVDPYAGARYTHLDVDLDRSRSRTIRRDQSERTIGGDKQWIDPIMGARAILQITESWSVSIRGDIGGFGVGSDFQWAANGVVGYQFSPLKFLFGYRALHQDYHSGSGSNEFEWDVILHGPVIALAITF